MPFSFAIIKWRNFAQLQYNKEAIIKHFLAVILIMCATPEDDAEPDSVSTPQHRTSRMCDPHSSPALFTLIWPISHEKKPCRVADYENQRGWM